MKTTNCSPLEPKPVHYNMNEKNTGQYYIQGNAVSPVDKNSGQYFIQGNAISPVPIVSSLSKVHIDDHVRVVPINNVENMAYVNYEANMNVA